MGERIGVIHQCGNRPLNEILVCQVFPRSGRARAGLCVGACVGRGVTSNFAVATRK